MRLFQARPAWDLLEGKRRYERKPTDEAFWAAVEAVARAIAAPFHTLEIDASKLRLSDRGDYIQAVALVLHRVIHQYVPENEPEADVPPLVDALVNRIRSRSQEERKATLEAFATKAVAEKPSNKSKRGTKKAQSANHPRKRKRRNAS